MTAPALLSGLKVLDFSQFLAGPYCTLRLQDLGAEVIKVENPNGGDLSRRLYLSDTKIGTDSTLFHAINRGKQSVSIDLKSPKGLSRAQNLIADADIVVQNFRPGVIDRLGMDYDRVKTLNPKLIYGSISGYGAENPWSHLPGQDLLAQARSGVMWLNGDRHDGPVPIGLPIADILAGANLAHGLLAALFRRERYGLGGHIETSLIEAMADLQFEFLSTYLNNGKKPPLRMETGSAHGYLAAPYAVFETSTGHLALAMGSLAKLAALLDMPNLTKLVAQFGDQTGFSHRDQVHTMVERRLRHENLETVETSLTAQGIWCAKVLDWNGFLGSKAFQSLDMLGTTPGLPYHFLRAPLRIDGKRPDITGLGPALPNT